MSSQHSHISAEFSAGPAPTIPGTNQPCFTVPRSSNAGAPVQSHGDPFMHTTGTACTQAPTVPSQGPSLSCTQPFHQDASQPSSLNAGGVHVSQQPPATRARSAVQANTLCKHRCHAPRSHVWRPATQSTSEQLATSNDHQHPAPHQMLRFVPDPVCIGLVPLQLQ